MLFGWAVGATNLRQHHGLRWGRGRGGGVWKRHLLRSEVLALLQDAGLCDLRVFGKERAKFCVHFSFISRLHDDS
jgi:hypothetical protein